jgi:YD repeat-containing protein
MKTFISLLATVLTLLPGSASALRISYSYDAAGRMTAVNYNGNARTAYGYDKNGSLLSRVNTVTPPLSPHLAATYTGLITNGTPDVGNTGIITLKLLANGTFSGKLTIQGASFAFAGKFLPSGSLETSPITIVRKPPLTNFTFNLNLDTQGSQQAILGSMNGVVGSASDIAMRADFFNLGGRLMGAGLATRYTMIFEANPGPPGVPQGTGFATVLVTAKGGITMVGKLPNNIAITQGTQIVGPNVWPLFVALHANQGYLVGQTLFINQGPVALQGFLNWGKPTTPGVFHPVSFTTSVVATGSRYIVPAAGQRALDFKPTSPNAVFDATFGNLAAPIIKNVTLDAKNKFITPVDANALKLTLAGATGLVTGTFKPSPTVTRSLNGVVMQGDVFASGFFVGDTEGGDFEIEDPAP